MALNKNMNPKKRSLNQISFFLLYTFSITWLSWLIIIVGNRYFNAFWYGEPLFWIPYLLSGIILTSSFTTLYKYTNNLLLCVLSHAWFNGCIGLALYIGNNGALQLNLNWKVIVVFSLELIVSVILGIAYRRKKDILYWQ
jgi:hypothetical protein